MNDHSWANEPDAYDEYWRYVMCNRMPFREETNRLVTVLYGFFLQQTEETDILEFWDSKRPYGNKNIENSIAFNLGWDYRRILCYKVMPDWVEAQALQLHEAVRLELLNETKCAKKDPEHFLNAKRVWTIESVSDAENMVTDLMNRE